MSDSNAHSPKQPAAPRGGRRRRPVPGGRHVKYSSELLSNLHLSLLDKIGVPIEKIGNSVAPLALG